MADCQRNWNPVKKMSEVLKWHFLQYLMKETRDAPDLRKKNRDHKFLLKNLVFT